MADKSSGRDIRFGELQDSFVRLFLKVEHGGLLTQFTAGLVHAPIIPPAGADASGFNLSETHLQTTTNQAPASRSTARQPMSARWKPLGQSIFFTAA